MVSTGRGDTDWYQRGVHAVRILSSKPCILFQLYSAPIDPPPGITPLGETIKQTKLERWHREGRNRAQETWVGDFMKHLSYLFPLSSLFVMLPSLLRTRE